MKQTLTTLFFLVFVMACTREPQLADDGVITAVSSPSPTITQVITAVLTPTTIVETPFIPNPRPTQTPRPTPTKYVAPPIPIPPPPLNGAALVQRLAFETVDGVNGRIPLAHRPTAHDTPTYHHARPTTRKFSAC